MMGELTKKRKFREKGEKRKVLDDDFSLQYRESGWHF